MHAIIWLLGWGEGKGGGEPKGLAPTTPNSLTKQSSFDPRNFRSICASCGIKLRLLVQLTSFCCQIEVDAIPCRSAQVKPNKAVLFMRITAEDIRKNSKVNFANHQNLFIYQATNMNSDYSSKS